MHIVLKPAGVLLAVGGVATLAAFVAIRPVQSNIESELETKPIEGFATRHKRKKTFNSKMEMQPVNLTQEGKIDWVCWATDSSHLSIRRSGDQPRISALTLDGGRSPQFSREKKGPSRGFLWTNGEAEAPKPVAYPGFHAKEEAFKFSVALDEKPRTITVYVGGFQAGGDLAATVSDGTKPVIKHTEIALGEGYYSRAYQINVQPKSDHQKVEITWKRVRGGGNVSIQAATLQ